MKGLMLGLLMFLGVGVWTTASASSVIYDFAEGVTGTYTKVYGELQLPAGINYIALVIPGHSARAIAQKNWAEKKQAELFAERGRIVATDLQSKGFSGKIEIASTSLEIGSKVLVLFSRAPLSSEELRAMIVQVLKEKKEEFRGSQGPQGTQGSQGMQGMQGIAGEGLPGPQGKMGTVTFVPITVPVVQTVTATTTTEAGTVTVIDERVGIENEEVFSEQARSRWGVGMNYPGLGVRYTGDKTTVELKTQFGKGVFVIGPRFYHDIGNSVFYYGGEVDYCTFKGSVSKCSGYVFGCFAGLEHFVSPNVGLSVDFGPAFISLKDKATGERDLGIDLILNIGLTYYFKGGEKK